MTDCQCQQSGFCSVRGCNVNDLLWQKCQAGHGESVTRLLSGAKNAKPRQAAVDVPDVSTIGTQIRAAIEAEIGRTLSCGDCIGYLKRLNKQAEHDHEAIVAHLYAQFPWPIEWREKNTRRKEAISRLIEPIVSYSATGGTT